MLIPTWLYSGVYYGLIAVVFVALVVFLNRRTQHGVAGTLPNARLVATPLLARIRPRLPIACMIAGPVCAWLLHHYSYETFVVSDGEFGPQDVRMMALGEPAERPPGDHDFEQVWVLNRSSIDIRIETKSYGRSVGPSEPIVIVPGGAITTYSIDYVGPDHPPPSRLEVDGIEAKLSSTTRSWLTWDPGSGS